MINYLNPASLTEQDVERLLKAGDGLPYKMTPAAYVKQWTEGKCQFWEISEPGDGIMVTKINEFPEGDELYLELVTGQKLLSDRKEILHEIETMAVRAEAKWIGCSVSNKALERVYKRMGFERILTRMRRPV
jgi:hypothetical protein